MIVIVCYSVDDTANTAGKWLPKHTIAGTRKELTEDGKFVASKPATQKPTAVSSRRKSLAAVSAMLDSIVDETDDDKENAVAPQRRNIDLGRALHSKSIEGATGRRESLRSRRKAVPVMPVAPQDKLGSEVWIDI